MRTLPYLVTSLPGLEPVVEDELMSKVERSQITERRRGRILFSTNAPLDRLLTLRTVDNVYLHLGSFDVGPHRAHLPQMVAEVTRLDLSSIPGVVPAGQRPDATIWVNASRSGRQTYSRFEAAAAAAEGLLRHPINWRMGTETEHDLEFRLDLEDNHAWLSLRLTPPSFRYRGDQRRFAQAALRPPVAHALVWLSAPAETDVFLDPFCGSGSLLSERLPYAAAQIIGSDLDIQALEIARHNLSDDERVTLANWDARDLPLDRHSVDKIVTNAPFGHQILTPSDIPALYLGFARQVQRLLTHNGQAVVLTDQVDPLFAAVEQTRLRAEEVLAVSLKGLHPRVLRLSLP